MDEDSYFNSYPLFFSVLNLAYFFPELDFRLALLVVGLVFLGMPHGAMDIYLFYKSLYTKKQTFFFIFSYLALSALILVLWTISPTVSFLFFATYSMFHFADSDLQKGILENKMNLLEFFARFALSLGLPLTFFKQQTLELISFIHPYIHFEPYLLVFQYLGFFSLGMTLVFTIISLYRFLIDFKNQDLTFLEPVVLCVLFSQITPLYALGIYFCFIHAVKHIVNVLSQVKIKTIRSILPYWLIPLVGLPILFYIYSQSKNYSIDNFQTHIFQYILITLSALAFPHAILIRYCKVLKIIK